MFDMKNKNSKFITILIAYVYLFFSPSLSASIHNNVLSTIHAQSSYDYYAWNDFEQDQKNRYSEDNYVIKKIIVKDWNLNKFNLKSSNFLNITLSGLINLDKDKCKDIIFDNQNLQTFERLFLKSFNAWQLQCKNKKSSKKSQLYFEKILNDIGPNFSDFIDFNRLSYLYLNQQKKDFIALYSEINFEKTQFISVNFKKLFLNPFMKIK